MKPAIFKDKEIQARFDRDGYVVMDFITADEAKIIAEKFYKVHPYTPKGFYSDAFNPDDALKQEIFEHTERIFEKVVAEKFCDVKKLGSTFLCKAPGQEGKVGVHQDWTVVDESKYYTLTIWVPTTEVNDQNGALRVLPGSHLFFDAYRSNSIEFPYRGNEELIWQNMTTVDMKPGQAFILNHAVIHGSSPNLTDKERLVIAYALAPKDAPLMYYYKDKKRSNNKVEKFSMPDDFFQRYYNVGDRPLFGDVVDEFEYVVPAASALKIKKLMELVATAGNDFSEEMVADFNRNFRETDIPLNPVEPPPFPVQEVKSTGNKNELSGWVDERSFFERYTPANIFTELQKKLFKRGA